MFLSFWQKRKKMVQMNIYSMFLCTHIVYSRYKELLIVFWDQLKPPQNYMSKSSELQSCNSGKLTTLRKIIWWGRVSLEINIFMIKTYSLMYLQLFITENFKQAQKQEQYKKLPSTYPKQHKVIFFLLCPQHFPTLSVFKQMQDIL